MTIGLGPEMISVPEQVEERLNLNVNDVTCSPETLKLIGVPCPVVPAHSPA
jgi:hypothetical protein